MRITQVMRTAHTLLGDSRPREYCHMQNYKLQPLFPPDQDMDLQGHDG